MSIETWLAFTAASAILLVIPGPTVLLVVSYALGQGWRTALPMAVGVALGDFTAMTLSLLGLGALLAASATVFTVLKWLGAAYLVYLGVKLWRAGGTPRRDSPAPMSRRPLKMLAHAFLVTALNPKSLTFFVAFLPQFIDQKAAFLPQVTHLCRHVPCARLRQCLLTYALVASRARQRRAATRGRSASSTRSAGAC